MVILKFIYTSMCVDIEILFKNFGVEVFSKNCLFKQDSTSEAKFHIHQTNKLLDSFEKLTLQILMRSLTSRQVKLCQKDSRCSNFMWRLDLNSLLDVTC